MTIKKRIGRDFFKAMDQPTHDGLNTYSCQQNGGGISV